MPTPAIQRRWKNLPGARVYQVTERQRGLLNTNTTAVGGIPAQQENFKVHMTTFGDRKDDKVGTRDNKLKKTDIAVGHYGKTQHPKKTDLWVLPYQAPVNVYPKNMPVFSGRVADVGAFDKKNPEYLPCSWIDIWDPVLSKAKKSDEGWINVTIFASEACRRCYVEGDCNWTP